MASKRWRSSVEQADGGGKDDGDGEDDDDDMEGNMEEEAVGSDDETLAIFAFFSEVVL